MNKLIGTSSDMTEWLSSLPDVASYNSIIMDINEYGSTSKAMCDVRVAKNKKTFHALCVTSMHCSNHAHFKNHYTFISILLIICFFALFP